MTEIDKSGLYIHIPFCKRKCNYCDFCSFAFGLEEQRKYTKALIDEISGYKRQKGKLALDTLYFGGGTPSLLDTELLKQIFLAIRDSFDILPDAEITLEVNPATHSYESLKTYRELGINRISIGLQSIHEKEQKKLGRIHNLRDFEDCYDTARGLGFDNISVDIMYGIPYQTKESFDLTLDYIIKKSPEHISAYGLIIEDGTPFSLERDTLALPTEDEECDMYYSADERLTLAGYSHYEISNYAKAGFESRHNLRYWKLRDYIGVGVSAHSYHLGVRYANTENFREYISGNYAHFKVPSSISKVPDEEEFIMLALRLSEGLDLKLYYECFGKDFRFGREEYISELISLGLADLRPDCFRLTKRGFYLSNTIISSLI